MILLSLFLSWKIWTKPANRSLQDHSKKESRVVQKKDMRDVYAPTKLVYHRDKDDIVYTNREATILSILGKLGEFSYEAPKQLSPQVSQTLIQESDQFSLIFPSELPVSLYLSMHQLDVALTEGMSRMTFNQVMVSLDRETLVFMNTDQTEAIELPIQGDFKAIERLLNSEKNNYFPVTQDENNVANVYYLSGDVHLKIYSYIVATQSFTTFSKAFFNQPNDLYANEGDNLNLSNGEGESLTIQNETGEVNYFGKLRPVSNQLSNMLFYNTFQYVESMGNALGTMRYFDRKDDDVMYRNYVEGFPVFGSNMKGGFETAIQNKNVFIRTNQETIQIPIPSDETVVLMPTDQMVEVLRSDGIDLEQVQDMQIGYTWQPNVETKQAVDLVPEWYIKYNHAWYTYPELKKQVLKGGEPNGL